MDKFEQPPFESSTLRDDWMKMIYQLQDAICGSLESLEEEKRFQEDVWKRPEGGGGRTRVIEGGTIFEKGGVNISTVFGEVTEGMRKNLNIAGHGWFACGLSLVIHPRNPFVPTVHCNYRMFELYDERGKRIDRWFGGGTDLTPYYLYEEDVVHFHNTYKEVCDFFSPQYYPQFKKTCDDYFVNTHRGNERRGVGGIFYDHQRGGEERSDERIASLGKACGEALIPSYLPIVKKRMNDDYSEENLRWQQIRRGRYVEFNLVHDRGTIFGLKTNGRIESILMSLPPQVRFEYNYTPRPGSPEEEIQKIFLNPKDWV